MVLIERDGYGFQLHFSLNWFCVFLCVWCAAAGMLPENRRQKKASTPCVPFDESFNQWNIYIARHSIMLYRVCVYSNFNMANEIACIINIVCVCVFSPSKQTSQCRWWMVWVDTELYEQRTNKFWAELASICALFIKSHGEASSRISI